MSQEPPPEDVFNILIATDIHLGYEENDPIRGDDSFNSFEEILQIAQENDVDFILLGGDLFHIAHPSADSMHRCMALLRKYCLGDRPISFEFLSDQEKVFENTSQKVVNYEDPNLNVSIPVFSIHGNHDDPTGRNMTSSLDILSSAGLVNYFGKTTDLSKVEVSPLLLQKGESFLAIYGLSHVKDLRLARLFNEEKVVFYRADEHLDDWFNVCVLHQNRVARGPKNYIPESALPSFLDLVIWGHEHDCRIDPEQVAGGNFFVSQPGSSVATSLIEGEAIPKKVGLLKVHKKNFKIEALKLETIRPFVIRDLAAYEQNFEDNLDGFSVQFELKAEEEVNDMIREAETMLTGHPNQPLLPLIRLRCLYDLEDQMFNIVRFGQKFEGKVANPAAVVLLKKHCEIKDKRDVLGKDALNAVLSRRDLVDLTVEDYIKKYFRDIDENESYRMNVLTVAGINEAVTQMVNKEDNNALPEIVKYQSSRMDKHLLTKDVDESNIEEEMRHFYVQRSEKAESEMEETRSHLASRKSGKPKDTTSNGNGLSSAWNENEDAVSLDGNDYDENEEDNFVDEFEVPKGRGRGRGSRGARGSRGTRGTRTPRAARAPRASRAGSTAGSRGRGRATQQTLQQSLSSQISVVRTSARTSTNRSRIQFESDSD